MTRIWYQSAAEMETSGKYREALRAHIDTVTDPGTQVDLHGVPAGTWAGKPPSALLGYPAIFHQALAPVFLGNALKAQREGYDAFIIGTYIEPFLTPLRAAVEIPVVSHLESSLLVGCSLGRTLGIITLNRQILWLIKQCIAQHRLEERVVALYALDPDFTEAQAIAAFSEPRKYVDLFMKLARQAVAEYADVIIPAEGILALALAMQSVREVEGAVILDGIAVPVAYAEMMVKLWKRVGLRVGRHWSYARPADPILAHYFPGP